MKPSIPRNKLFRQKAFPGRKPWNQEFAFNQTTSLFKKSKNRFTKTEIMKKEELKVPEIGIEDSTKVHIVIGTIKESVTLEKSDKLLKLRVNCGEYNMRQIPANVKKFYKPGKAYWTAKGLCR